MTIRFSPKNFLECTVILTALLAFIILSKPIIQNQVSSSDLFLSNYIYSFRMPFLTNLMKVFTFLGGAIFIGVSSLVAMFILWRQSKKDTLFFGSVMMLSVTANTLLKDFFHRPRPDFSQLVTENSYSFPSGHAMNSLVFYLAVWFIFFRSLKNKKIRNILTVTLIILVFLIGLSRIYLGIHYPSDVLAGFAAGVICFTSVLLLEKIIHSTGNRSKSR